MSYKSLATAKPGSGMNLTARSGVTRLLGTSNSSAPMFLTDIRADLRADPLSGKTALPRSAVPPDASARILAAARPFPVAPAPAAFRLRTSVVLTQHAWTVIRHLRWPAAPAVERRPANTAVASTATKPRARDAGTRKVPSLPPYATQFDPPQGIVIPSEPSLVLFLPETTERPHALRVVRRKSRHGTWFEFEAYHAGVDRWVLRETCSNEAAAVALANGTSPEMADELRT
jgi:hypothetical protein